MNRGLVYSLCAAALVAVGANSAQAVINVSLNLTYTDPANEAGGGTWQLVAKTSDAASIAALNAVIDNVDNGVGPDDVTLNSGIGAIDPIDAGGLNERPAYLPTASGVDLIYGQDISAPATVVTGVGSGAGAGNLPTDQFLNASWNNSALIASGSFSGSRPSFVGVDGNILGGANPNFTAADDGATTSVVRGDGVATDGLKGGDANRDNIVNVTDLGILATNWQLTGKGWNQGNFSGTNNDDIVNVTDLGILATNWQLSRTPPVVAAVGAVPEPASIALLVLGGLGCLAASRRK